MKNSSKDRAILIFSAIATLVIIGGSIYFYIYSKNKKQSDDVLITSIKNSLQSGSTKDQLSAGLSKAESNLQLQTSRLAVLQSELGKQQSFLSSMKTGFETVSAAVDETDIMFQNPETSAPKIKIWTETKEIQIEINLKRLQVTYALDSWKTEISKAQAEGASAEDRARVQGYVETVRSYLAELQEIVDALSTESSGLKQAQIDSYIAIVEEASQSVDAVISALLPTTTTVVFHSDGDLVAPLVNVVVTPEEVAVQEAVVVQAQTQVEVLQNAINNEIQNETQASSTENIALPTESQGQDTSIIINTNYSTAQGIVSQPGEPQLIPGANRFEN